MTDTDHVTAVKAAAEALVRATDNAQKSGLVVNLEIVSTVVTGPQNFPPEADIHRCYTFKVHVAVSRPL